MSGYIIDDGEDVYKVFLENDVIKEIPNYKKEKISNKQHKRYKKVVRHIKGVWQDIENILKFYISYDIDTNDLMLIIHKLFFKHSKKDKKLFFS